MHRVGSVKVTYGACSTETKFAWKDYVSDSQVQEKL